MFAVGAILLSMGIGEAIGTLLAHLVEEQHRSRFNEEFEEERSRLKEERRIQLKTRDGKDLCMVCEDNFVSTKFQSCEAELMCSQCARNYWKMAEHSGSSPKCPQCHKVVEKVEYF